jgi:hypothetical protein
MQLAISYQVTIGFRHHDKLHGGPRRWEAILEIIDSDSSNQQEESIAPAANHVDVTPSHATSTATAPAGASAAPAEPATASAAGMTSWPHPRMWSKVRSQHGIQHLAPSTTNTDY